MKGYWINRCHVTNSEVYGDYAKLAGPAIEKFGGRFLVRAGQQVELEGGPYERTVLVEFDSMEDALGKTEEGTDAYLQGGIRLGDSDGWELSLYMENTKVAEVDTYEVCPVSSSCYTDVDYTLSEETDSAMGIKFVNNFRENMSFSVNMDNNDSAGSTASLGIRFRL